MNNLSMAFKNLKKNLSFYTLYLLSVSFVITVLFAFTSFSMNNVMLQKISTDGRVETMCSPISVFLSIFVVFYMAYSNSFFLKRRTKELGIYGLMGYRKSKILSLLTFENILICSGAFLPIGMLTMLLVVVGTVFFISSFLPYVVQKSKERKGTLYTQTNIITTPNFIYRIRSNSKTLIMLTLLSAATLTISNVMALTLYYPIAAVSRIAPSEIEFRIENDSQGDAVKQLVHQNISDNTITFTKTDIYKVTSSAEKLPVEYNIKTAKGDGDNERLLRKSGFECISYTNYISLLQAQSKNAIIPSLTELNNDECILVKYQPNRDNFSEIGDTYPLIIGNDSVSLTVVETTLNNPISFANSIGTLIVSDEIYNRIAAREKTFTSVMSLNGKSLKDNEILYEKINRLLNNSPYLQGNSHRINELFSLNSSTFLLIGFLVVLFFIATGSILYFNNISMIADSKSDYEILIKMGYTDKHIKQSFCHYVWNTVCCKCDLFLFRRNVSFQTCSFRTEK